MRTFARLSIRTKLIAVVAAAILGALLVGFAVAAALGIRQLRADLVETTTVISRAVGQFSSVPLAFDETVEAERSLAALGAFESIVFAELFNLEKSSVATFRRQPAQEADRRFFEQRVLIEGSMVHCWQPVVFDGKKYGTIYVRASADALERRIAKYLLHLSILLLVVLGLAILLAYLLQGSITRPILALAEVASRLSRDGDFKIRVTKPSHDEIGVLYQGFNDMLAQIDLRQTELERSNRDLDQFAYVASHDLKAPLRAISTLAGWLEEDLAERLSADEREQLQLLRARIQRMDNLIEGILRYSRASRLETDFEKVDVGRLVAELAEELGIATKIRVEIAPDLPILETRRLRLSQVFANLISNAIKYHDRPEGTVRISHRLCDGIDEFAVADDGPGIAPEHHAKIFQIFQTLQPRDQVESTGLGLALVKKLVEEEGGRIWIDSAIGLGATFRFTWPVPKTGAEPLA